MIHDFIIQFSISGPTSIHPSLSLLFAYFYCYLFFNFCHFFSKTSNYLCHSLSIPSAFPTGNLFTGNFYNFLRVYFLAFGISAIHQGTWHPEVWRRLAKDLRRGLSQSVKKVIALPFLYALAVLPTLWMQVSMELGKSQFMTRLTFLKSIPLATISVVISIQYFPESKSLIIFCLSSLSLSLDKS